MYLLDLEKAFLNREGGFPSVKNTILGWEMHFGSLGNAILGSENHSRSVGNAILGCETYPQSCGMQFRIAKPIPRIVECWRKMRNHSAEMKSLIAKCAACFFSEKSNFQPGIGLFIFEKSNRKLRRILFF